MEETTLGRQHYQEFLRSMETGSISDKYGQPSFCVAWRDGGEINEKQLAGHDTIIRVFTEDFIKENLKFIANPDEKINPFATLGGDNNLIEKEIKEIEEEIGSKDEGKELGLYAKAINLHNSYKVADEEYKRADQILKTELSDKATKNPSGIKYNSEKFGDQNYTIVKLNADIVTVLKNDYQPIANEECNGLQRVIEEKRNGMLLPVQKLDLSFGSLHQRSEVIIGKNVAATNKIQELVKNALLNRWVKMVKNITMAFLINVHFVEMI